MKFSQENVRRYSVLTTDLIPILAIHRNLQSELSNFNIIISQHKKSDEQPLKSRPSSLSVDPEQSTQVEINKPAHENRCKCPNQEHVYTNIPGPEKQC